VAAKAGVVVTLDEYGSGLPLTRAEDRALLRWAIRSGGALSLSHASNRPGKKAVEVKIRPTAITPGDTAALVGTGPTGEPVEIVLRAILSVRRA
jgi:hypothetical protein